MPEIEPLRIDLPEQLVSERVLLRPWRESDAYGLWEAVDSSRASLGEWMPWVGEYRSPEDAAPVIRRMRSWWLLRQDLVLGIFDKDTGQVLGGSGLHRIDWRIRRFEIGYWLRDSAVGHGYVTEAVRVLTRFAFEQLEANRVEIRMDPQNTRSRAIPVRLAYVYEGCLRQSIPDVHGAPRDADVFALTRHDYHTLQSHRIED
jgi:RimJ/RimL family protein N-acetyltransferase